MVESWTTWADEQPELSPSTLALLEQQLGTLTPARAADIGAARLPTSALDEQVRRALEAALGSGAVRVDDEARAAHAGGQAYADLVRRRAGDAGDAPDAVLLPGDATAVSVVLRICTENKVAVVPWGGGTSVVGGLSALRGDCAAVVALDLSRLDRLLSVDETSLLATFQPGIRTPATEAALAPYGLTLGHVPQSYERASLGGYVVTRSAGQASTGYGRVDDMVAGLKLVTPIGELVLPAMPGSAAGPDLKRLVLGSEGTLGVVTEVTLRVRRTPEQRVYEGWMAPSWDAGLTALRSFAQVGPAPTIARLSDHDETRISLAMSAGGGLTRHALGAYLRLRRVREGCLLIVGYEGARDDVAHRRRCVHATLSDAGAVSLGTRAGRSWEHGRFAGPRLRDTLLDHGVVAETLETAATWSTLPDLYAAVRAALRDALGRSLVGCHVSHLYPDGASLYFTALAAAHTGAEVEQWSTAKRAANDAIVAAGGTITHHHAVGTAHRDHVVHDLGELGIEALRAVKQRLDPAGILNPGKLLPDPVPRHAGRGRVGAARP